MSSLAVAAIACGTAPLAVAAAIRLNGRGYRRSTDHHRLHRGAWWLAIAIPVVAATWTAILSPTTPAWPAAVLVACGWLIATETDLDVHRIPDAVTLPSYAVFASTLAVLLALHHIEPATVTTAFASSLTLAGISLVLGIITGQVGLGDVKLLAGVGLVLGAVSVPTLCVAVALMTLIGIAASSYTLLRGRGTPTTPLAAGPGITAGALLAPVVMALAR
jgi:leader peptidase (prepilin peptidase)/N-methyltransferase